MTDQTRDGSSAPRVTVAIPTRNRADLLARAINSALAQTFSALRVVILDDESDDHTADVVRSYSDPRLEHVRNELRIGMAANWNRGFELADSDLVAVLHDDDRLHPRFIEQAAAIFDDRPDMAFVFAATISVDEHNTELSGPLLSLPKTDRVMEPAEGVERFVSNAMASWPAVLWRREAVLEVGGFADDHPFTKDWQLHIKLAARHAVGFISQSLGYTTIHSGQFTSDFGSKPLVIARDRHEMLRETIASLPLPAYRRRALLDTAMRSLAETQLVTAWDLASQGMRSQARQEARYAKEIDPSVTRRTPLLVAAARLGAVMPAGVVRALDRFRARLRPVLRRT